MSASPGRFISGRITPDPAALDTATAAAGEPALPMRFSWRGKTYRVVRVIARRKGYAPDRTHGSGELYLHRHWLEVEVDDGTIMTLDFERQPVSRRPGTSRGAGHGRYWWLYSVREAS